MILKAVLFEQILKTIRLFLYTFLLGRSGVRQDFKMGFLTDFQEYIGSLKKQIPNLIISGDYNICHEAIDIHNPVTNKNTSGFLPEERAWVSGFIERICRQF